MEQIQAIFAQAATPKFGVAEAVGDTVTQAGQWLGRTVTYAASVVSEYAAKAWQFGAAFFATSLEFVRANQENFSYFGAAAAVTVVGYVVARVLGVGSQGSAPAVQVPAVQKA